MIKKYTHNSITWIDLESPTREEVRTIMEEYALHPLTAEEMLSPTLKPSIDFKNSYVYVILHFPAVKHSHSNEMNQEVDFILGEDVLITVRYDMVDPLHKFSKEFEVKAMLHEKEPRHAGILFFKMVRTLYGSLEQELEYIEARIREIERKMFEGKEKQMVTEISHVSRNLMDFRQSLIPHERVLERLSHASRKLFDDSFDAYVEELTRVYKNIRELAEGLEDVIFEVRETNNSLLTTKQNEAMKMLAIMAFATFPLSLIASIFGMNTDYLPVVGHPNDFWIIAGVMGILTVIFFSFFKYKKWL